MATARGKDGITDQLIATSALYFDANQVKMVAVLFLGEPSTRVANMTDEARGDSQTVIRELLMSWRNKKSPTVQVFFIVTLFNIPISVFIEVTRSKGRKLMLPDRGWISNIDHKQKYSLN